MMASMVRKQILVPPDVDARVRRIAQERGISQSAVIVEAVRSLPEAHQDVQRILSFAGIIDGPAEALSERVDEILYGG
jgi:predicted transcriptional regulator